MVSDLDCGQEVRLAVPMNLRPQPVAADAVYEGALRYLVPCGLGARTGPRHPSTQLRLCRGMQCQRTINWQRRSRRFCWMHRGILYAA